MENVSDFELPELPELLATEGGGDYELPPVGTWQGVCYSVVDIGTQTGDFQGNVIVSKKIRIGFEFADDDDKIHTIHKEFTLSFNGKSKLKKFIDDMNGGETKMTNEEAKGFNVFTLLNRECSLNIIRKKSAKGAEYADIGGLSPRIKKIVLHARKNKNIWLSLTEKYYNEESFEILPNFIKDKIITSPEYKALYGIVDIEEQETEIQKQIRESVPVTSKEADEVFLNDEASGEEFTQPVKKVLDNPFNEN